MFGRESIGGMVIYTEENQDEAKILVDKIIKLWQIGHQPPNPAEFSITKVLRYAIYRKVTSLLD